MATLLVIDLRIDELQGCFSPRRSHEDPNHARALAETYSQLPPAVVHRQTMKVIDGAHRVLAAKILGHPVVPAMLFDGSEEEAFVEAVRRNVEHGKPLTLVERDQAASTLLRSHPEWSDRRIAELCGLSDKTVARARHRATADARQSSERVGRDGRRRPVDPATTRLRVGEYIALHPESSDRAVATATATSQATVRDVRQRIARGDSPLPPKAPSDYLEEEARIEGW